MRIVDMYTSWESIWSLCMLLCPYLMNQRPMPCFFRHRRLYKSSGCCIISGGQGLTGTTCELDSSPFLPGESMFACHWSQRQFSWLGFQMCRWGSMLVWYLCSLGEHASTNHGTFSFQVIGAACPGLVGRACLFHMFLGNPLTIWWHQQLDIALQFGGVC